MTNFPFDQVSDHIKTSIVVYAHKLDDKNLFLLFKKNLDSKVDTKANSNENWQVLEETIAISTEDAQTWLANYLGVKEGEVDMQRVKYVQDGKSVEMERILVFKADETVLDKITGLNPNSKWISISEIPKLLALGRISQQLSNLIAGIQNWRVDLNKINHLKFDIPLAPFVISDTLFNNANSEMWI